MMRNGRRGMGGMGSEYLYLMSDRVVLGGTDVG